LFVRCISVLSGSTKDDLFAVDDLLLRGKGGLLMNLRNDPFFF